MKNADKTNKWQDLSVEAKGVIEWVESPYTHKRMVVEVELNKYFSPVKDVNILITSELFEEILSYVKFDSNLTYNMAGDWKFTFKIKDDIDLKLH